MSGEICSLSHACRGVAVERSERPVGFTSMSPKDEEPDMRLGHRGRGHVMVRLMSHQQMSSNHTRGERAAVSTCHR